MASIDASTSGAGGIITTADNTGTLNLQSGGSTIATVSSTGLSMATGKTFSVGGITGSPYTMKNRIINGAMLIDQRNAGASVTINSGTGAYTLDRWDGRGETSQGVYTIQQSSTAPTGFNKSLLVTVTTADSSLASGDNYYVRQIIEGFNIADLGWGTASAQTVTLSFWVRSSLTGTFGGAITNASTSTRAYGFTYTISSANTWEQKTITITGDTTGTWNTDNSSGMIINFSLGANADRQTTANTWSAISSVIISGATGEGSIIGTNAATWYVTGVQLEVGSSATSFEWRPYGMELSLCQRYYQKYTSIAAGDGICFGGYGFPQSASIFRLPGSFPIPFRGTPTFSYSNLSVSTSGGTQSTVSSSAGMSANSTGFDLNLNVTVTTGTPYFLRATAGNNGYVDFSAEL